MFLDKNWACLEITELRQLILLNASQSKFCPPLVVSQYTRTKTDGRLTEQEIIQKQGLSTGTSRYDLKTSPDSLRE